MKKFIATLATLFAIQIGAVASAQNYIPSDAFKYNGHSYYIYSGICETWEEAEEFCESLGGYLAVLNDIDENTAVFDFVKSRRYSNAYFGLTRATYDGKWRWINGEPIRFTNWNPGEPNNERGAECYGMFYWKFSYTWNDGDFGHGTNGDDRAFICEWDFTRS